MKVICIPYLSIEETFMPYILEVEERDNQSLMVKKFIEGIPFNPRVVLREWCILYTDEIWKTCQQMREQYDILWKMQLNLSEMALKRIEKA